MMKWKNKKSEISRSWLAEILITLPAMNHHEQAMIDKPSSNYGLKENHEAKPSFHVHPLNAISSHSHQPPSHPCSTRGSSQNDAPRAVHQLGHLHLIEEQLHDLKVGDRYVTGDGSMAMIQNENWPVLEVVSSYSHA